MRRQRGRRWALLPALAALALLLGAAATEGVGSLGHPSPPHLPSMMGGGLQAQTPSASPTPSQAPSMPPQTGGGLDLTWLVELVKWGLIAAAFCFAVVVAVRIVRNFSVDVAEEADDGVAGEDQASVDTRQMALHLRSTLDELTTTSDFSGAVIACWRRLEDLAGESGAVREPWQSTTEFSLEVLRRTPANADDLAELASIYQRACYASTQPGEAERARAVDCLQRLTETLEAHQRNPRPAPETPDEEARSPWARPADEGERP